MALFFYQTPIGKIALRENGYALTHVYLHGNMYQDDELPQETLLLRQAMAQIREYFAGELKEFTLPIAPEGTPFMKRVWEALRQIPYGQTRAYGEVARMLDMPKAARAIGMASGRNPMPLLIPCHRVIGANGGLVGFGGGLEIKAELLRLERRYCP